MAHRVTSNSRLERAVRPLVQKGKLDLAIARCEAALAKLPRTDYHAVVGRSWLGQTKDAVRWLAGFYRTASKSQSIRSLYCEMNRFEINCDDWYLDAFGYDLFGGSDDLDWLVSSKKNSSRRNRFKLLGMSDLQALFARDYRDEPPVPIRSASETTILLLTLRMQELVHAAAEQARQLGLLPDEVPILSAAHDSDLVSVSFGRTVPLVTQFEPPRPKEPTLPRRSARLGIYKMEGGYDEFGNSLPWDVLDYESESHRSMYRDQVDRAVSLAKTWVSPRVSLRKRKWRCDLISLYPHWAVNEKARAALAPLLRRTVEFLPLRYGENSQLWLLHPLRHIDLSQSAVHNAENGGNMTFVSRYAFETKALQGKHLFGVKQAKGSVSRRVGYCFGANYVSEEFRRVVGEAKLQGVVFEKIFSYSAPKET